MTETITRIRLGELSTVRVVCTCGTVVETELDKMGAVADTGRCRHCGTGWHDGGERPLQDFANAVKSLTKLSKVICFEFPVHSDD